MKIHFVRFCLICCAVGGAVSTAFPNSAHATAVALGIMGFGSGLTLMASFSSGADDAAGIILEGAGGGFVLALFGFLEGLKNPYKATEHGLVPVLYGVIDGLLVGALVVGMAFIVNQVRGYFSHKGPL